MERLSEAEWKILHVCWRLQRASAREVLAELRQTKSVALRTLQGQYEEAETLLDLTLAGRKRKLGDDPGVPDERERTRAVGRRRTGADDHAEVVRTVGTGMWPGADRGQVDPTAGLGPGVRAADAAEAATDGHAAR